MKLGRYVTVDDGGNLCHVSVDPSIYYNQRALMSQLIHGLGHEITLVYLVYYSVNNVGGASISINLFPGMYLRARSFGVFRNKNIFRIYGAE